MQLMTSTYSEGISFGLLVMEYNLYGYCVVFRHSENVVFATLSKCSLVTESIAINCHINKTWLKVVHSFVMTSPAIMAPS